MKVKYSKSLHNKSRCLNTMEVFSDLQNHRHWDILVFSKSSYSTETSWSRFCFALYIFTAYRFEYLSNVHPFYGFTGVITHAGCWENTRKACKSWAEGKWFPSFSSVFPTSRVGYHAGKPIESVAYCFHKITLSFLWVYQHNKP